MKDKIEKINMNVNYIKKQFLRCTPLQKLHLGESKYHVINDYNFDVQQNILNNTIKNNLVKRYPIKKSYQQAFLKFLMEKIEKNGNQICEDIYIVYCDLISKSDKEETCYQHYLTESNENLNCITVEESNTIISNGTTGLCTWQATFGLIEWFKKYKEEFRDKKVLELGCGVGLAGLSIISMCLPKQYVFTDCHPDVLNMAYKNITLNLLDENIECPQQLAKEETRWKLDLLYKDVEVRLTKLKWENIHDYINNESSLPDIIVGSDILYETDSFDTLQTGLKMFFTSGSKYAIIAVTVRNDDTFQLFKDKLVKHNLKFEEYTSRSLDILIKPTDPIIKIIKIFEEEY